MIKIENIDIHGWEAAIRGMRNPVNSWDKSDSKFNVIFENCFDGVVQPIKSTFIGENDLALMKRLAKNGSVHAKYRRMITVTVDILAPLYWWKEFDTYKVGTVANSCSTMHKIADKEFTLDDFSHEHVETEGKITEKSAAIPYIHALEYIISFLNYARNDYLKTKDKKYWWQMIQLLPSSYNQKRTVMFNYEVLAGIYHQRKNHKLDEWCEFCGWIEKLPYSEIITGDITSEKGEHNNEQ